MRPLLIVLLRGRSLQGGGANLFPPRMVAVGQRQQLRLELTGEGSSTDRRLLDWNTNLRLLSG